MFKKNSEKELERLEKSAISSRRIHEGHIISLRQDDLPDEEGKIHHYDIIEHPGAVVMIPIDDQGRIFFVKQYRRAAHKIILELPAGTLEDKEHIEACAMRELQEEIGYRAEKLTACGGFYSAPGFCTEFLHFFLAEHLIPDPLKGEDSHAIDIAPYTLEEALEMVQTHKIDDLKTVAGILMYKEHCERHG